jgi:DMSO reductase anchor subunit
MVKLYMMRTVPAWRGLYTPLSFLGTTLLLGPLGVAFSYDTLLDLGRKARPFLDAAAIVALAAVVLIILTLFLFTPGLGLFGPKKATLLELPAAKMYPYLLFRLLFLSGTVLCSFLYYRNPTSPLLTLAFLSALAAEAAGRLLFYAVYSRLGV